MILVLKKIKIKTTIYTKEVLKKSFKNMLNNLLVRKSMTQKIKKKSVILGKEVQKIIFRKMHNSWSGIPRKKVKKFLIKKLLS